MSARVALIVGSTLAAAVVVVPLAYFAVWFDSEPASSNAMWIAQLRLTLPAMLAAFSSAWWHSGKGRVIDCPDEGTLSARIVWWSFPVFATIIALVMSIESGVYAEPGTGSGGDLMLGAVSVFVMIMLSSIVLFLPAFFLEYAVVRLVCARCIRAVSPGVVP